MQKVNCILALMFALVSSEVFAAQIDKTVEHRSIRTTLDFWVSTTEQLVVPAAEAMPEPKYSFIPGNGAFKDVRTFAEQVKHLAAANYQLGAGILGEDPPLGTKDEKAPDSVNTKAQIVEYLKGSFVCLHRAAAAIDEENMNRVVSTKGDRTRMWLMLDALVHSSNHYGQMVEYLRMNDIVPPASR